jgi:hypothetical protein
VRALAADGFGTGDREAAGDQPADCRGVARSSEPPRYRRESPGSKLDPFEPLLLLRWLLEEWPQIRAPRATELLRARLRLRELRPSSMRPAQRTAIGPDWCCSSIGRRCRHSRRSVDVGDGCMRLLPRCPTRPRRPPWFSFEMTIESFLEGHVRTVRARSAPSPRPGCRRGHLCPGGVLRRRRAPEAANAVFRSAHTNP